MALPGKFTPLVLANALRENMNPKGTFKAQFKSLLMSKFTEDELNGIRVAAEGEILKRKQAVVDDKIKFLEDMGYKVSK